MIPVRSQFDQELTSESLDKTVLTIYERTFNAKLTCYFGAVQSAKVIKCSVLLEIQDLPHFEESRVILNPGHGAIFLLDIVILFFLH